MVDCSARELISKRAEFIEIILLERCRVRVLRAYNIDMTNTQTIDNDSFASHPAFWNAIDEAIETGCASDVVRSLHALGYDFDVAESGLEHTVNLLEEAFLNDGFEDASMLAFTELTLATTLLNEIFA